MATYLPDVNVLLYAIRPLSTFHRESVNWINETLSNGDALVLLDLVVVGFLRLATDAKVYRPAASIGEAVAIVEELLAWPSVSRAVAPPTTFATMATVGPEIAGKNVTDLYLAAASMDLGATLVTFDRGFRKFRGLSWLIPTGT